MLRNGQLLCRRAGSCQRTCMNLMRRRVSSACALVAACFMARASRFQCSSLRFASCIGRVGCLH